MLRDGLVVWTGIGLRADLTADVEEPLRWKMCRPDVFSIRNTTVASYLEPIVHEIKVSRADLLGDLKYKDKRDSYLDVSNQCWYVLRCDSKGRPFGQADDMPPECGVLIAEPDRLHVARNAAKKTSRVFLLRSGWRSPRLFRFIRATRQVRNYRFNQDAANCVFTAKKICLRRYREQIKKINNVINCGMVMQNPARYLTENPDSVNPLYQAGASSQTRCQQ